METRLQCQATFLRSPICSNSAGISSIRSAVISMKAPLIVSIFTLVGTAFGAIDLTPTTAERVLDGIKFQQLIFRDGEHSITYEPPHGWNYSGDASQLKLTPPSVSQAQGVIEQSRLAAPQQFTEAVIKELQ